MEDGTLILVAGGLLALGIAASLLAGRLRVPGLLLVLGLGMVLGSDVLSLLDFGGDIEDVELARTIGIVAVALILFEGGLAAGWGEIRPVLGVSLSLATVGTVITAVVVGLAAAWLLDLTTLEGLLLGLDRGLHRQRRDLLGAARVEHRPPPRAHARGRVGLQRPGGDRAGARVHRVHPAARLRRGGHARCCPSASWASARPRGWRSATWRCRPSSARPSRTPGLYPVASIATAALAYGVADVAHGSGFMSVYVTALMLGSASIPSKRTVLDFHDGLAWVSQIALFLTLGLLVNPGEFGDITGEGAADLRRADLRGAAAGRRDLDGAVQLPPARVARWSAGPACAARCRSCWPPSP